MDFYRWERVEPHYRALLEEPLAPDLVPAWLRRWSDLEKGVWEARAHLKRATYRDVTDESAARAFQAFVAEVLGPALAAGQALVEKLLAAVGFEVAPEHVQMLRRFRAGVGLYSSETNALLGELSALEGAYSRIVGGMVVEFGGQRLTLAQMQRFDLDPDRGVRAAAWRATQDARLRQRQALDDLFMRLLDARRRLANAAALPDYRAYRWRQLGRLDYAPADAHAFHAAIESEIVPLAARRRDARRQKLGLDMLRPWDLGVDPDAGQPLASFATVSDLEAGVGRILAALDPELGALFERLRTSGQLDVESRPGKAPGAEEWLCPQSGLPSIHMNAAGSHGDVLTLLHESGHAFHDLLVCTQDPLFWNLGGPTEFEEFAALTMEFLAGPFLDRAGVYSSADLAWVRRHQLEGAIQSLPQVAVVDAFQHWLYTAPADEVTPAALDVKWTELRRRFFPDVDWRGLEVELGSGWHRVGHIYTAPLYYIEYGLAQLGALQVVRKARDDRPGALRAYRAALAAGNTLPLPELYRMAGAELPFDRAVVRDVGQLLEELVDS